MGAAHAGERLGQHGVGHRAVGLPAQMFQRLSGSSGSRARRRAPAPAASSGRSDGIPHLGEGRAEDHRLALIPSRIG